ncbi:hypothetical protein [Miniphocaeibacter halophilus]|uniref:Uncharacterized protein n=1 Tax=Miniphocaeibacter halophilus TaxID=2931922 RepID=A0AC61MQ00_9FIRM|nr:hypothetical protein [Miniphocaeibacter halophilus]QQK06974.1 hypothetical protein JFY71_06390 [Miniphocaeibacter halophilus]
MSISKIITRKNLKLKNLTIALIIGALLVFLFFSPGALTINGKPINSFEGAISTLLPVTMFFSSVIATFISANSIPDEYNKKRNQLIYIRGIKQPEYHLKISLGNIISSVFFMALLFIPVIVVGVRYGDNINLIKLIGMFFLLLPNIIFISLVSTSLSNIGGFLLGTIGGMFFTIIGYFHEMLEFFSKITEGILSKIIEIVLKITPNLYEVLNIGKNYLFGNKVSYKPLIAVGIGIIIGLIVLIVYKRKND